MHINVIIEISDLDTIFLGLNTDNDVSESIIVDRFKEMISTGETGELVRVVHEDCVLYTVRTLEETFVDDTEYVDNEGNPIDEDGNAILASDEIITDDPSYAYDFDTIWVLSKAKIDEALCFETYKFIDLLHGIPMNPFEDNEELVIVHSA